MHARITRLDKSIELPKYHTTESAAFDIASSNDVVIPPGEIAKVPTGLVIEAPEGHCLIISARSSLGVKKGLQGINGIGVIDRDYAGPADQIFLMLRNFTEEPVTITKGERLCQGMFIKIDQAEWEEVETINTENRGGIGSTGGYQN